MANVTSFETLAYNGFVFPTELDLRVTMRPRSDQADRVVTVNVYTIEANFLLAERDNQDLPAAARDTLEGTFMPRIRRQLGEWGKALVLIDSGYGDLSVGDSETVEWFDDQDNAVEFDEPLGRQDANWGPKVRDLVWQPIGPRAARVRWVCEVAVKECEEDETQQIVLGGAADPIPRLMAYNYSVATSKDEEGYLTRTVSGYLEIPMTRVGGGREPPDTADAYLTPNVIPPVPPGFGRGPVQTLLSEDKRRLNFSFVDTELPRKVLPAGVVNCRASHSVSTSEKSLSFYRGTIRASYTLRKDLDKSAALLLFFKLIADRLTAANRGGMRAFIPLSLTADDPDIYGRSAASFGFGYAFSIATDANDARNQGVQGPFGINLVGGAVVPVGPLFLDKLKGRSALWGPAPGGDEKKWKESMRSVFHPRGLTGIGQRAVDDYLIDLCERDGVGATRPAGDKVIFRIANPAVGKDVLAIAVPAEGLLKYDTRLEVLIDDPGLIIERKVLGAAAVAANVGGGLLFNPITNWLLGLPLDHRAPTVVPFQRTTPRLIARLDFDIISFKKAVKIPNLTGVMGLEADKIVRATEHDLKGRVVPARHDVQIVGNLWGVDIVRLRGHQCYVLLDVPTHIPEHPPDYFVDGKPVHGAGWNGINNFAL